MAIFWAHLAANSFLPHDGAINVPRPLVNGEGKQGGREMRGRAWDHKA